MRRIAPMLALVALAACQDLPLQDNQVPPSETETASTYEDVGSLTGAALTAEERNVWFSNESDIDYTRQDWMGDLPGDLLISELSVPGTHETMARFGGPAPRCQTLTLDRQLNAGLRAFDIRLRHIENVFAIHHAGYFQNAFFGDDVLQVFVDFLAAHPTETIFMRVKREHNVKDVTRSFGETFAWYMSMYGSAVWQTTDNSTYPTLGEVRGKIVILQNCRADEDDDGTCVEGMFEPVKEYGYPWNDLFIQDDYVVYWTHASMNGKADSIRYHFENAILGDPADMYVNFTSGSAGMNPVDVARGIWIPFRYSDGMNERTYRYLSLLLAQDYIGRLGVVMSDFPGAGLIDVIIAHNGLPLSLDNSPPEAKANGPYVADEAAAIAFDATGSTDADDDPLQYRWDIDGDDEFDTDWSSDPTAIYTWFDDYEGIAQVEATDGQPTHVDRDVAQVTVINVAPVVVIDGLASPVHGCILPGQVVDFSGSFTDPSHLDTHAAEWDFGDGTIMPGTSTEENEPPGSSGTVSNAHVYTTPGTYEAVLDVLDDDGGIGSAATSVKVMTAKEAVDFIDDYIQALPESFFKQPSDNRKATLSDKLDAVRQILDGETAAATANKLRNDLRAKMDGSLGENPNNDWILEAEAQGDLCLMIDELIKYLER